MRNPKLLVLILLSLAMAGYLYFGEFQIRRERDREALRAARIFPEIAVRDIDSMSFVTADGYEASLKRTSGRWRLEQPVAAYADQNIVAGLVASLTGLMAQERLGDVSESAAYGLGEGARRIAFRAGGTNYALLLGRTAPVGRQRYVSREGSREVALVAGGALQGFDRLLRDYRPRGLFPPELMSVRRIEIAWRKEKADLEKQEDVWWIVAPVHARAAQATVTALLSQLAELQADDFVDTPSEAQRASLASPEMILRLEGISSADSSPFSRRLAIAGDAGANRLLVQSGEETPVFVRASALQHLPENLGDVRDLILSAFPKADAQVVQIDRMAESTGNRVHIRFERDGDDWVEAGGAPSGKSSSQVQQLVDQLSSLRADSVVAESVGVEEGAALHLDPAFTRVRVFGESGEALADLRISDRTLGSGEQLLQSGDRPELYSGRVDVRSIPVP